MSEIPALADRGPSHLLSTPVPSPIDQGIILITGASSGVGRAIAEQIAPRARGLALVARRKDRLEALKADLAARYPALSIRVFGCDITKRAATDQMLDSLHADLGAVDVLINNAGFGDLGVFDMSSLDKQEQMIDLNVKSLLYLTHRVIAPMVAKKRGGILNISSGFGLTLGPAMATYIGTKHFVTAFTEALRIDLAGTGVRVTQVCPGPVATEFNDVMGNFTGMEPPGFVTISAERCARASIRALDRNRAMVIPGVWMKFLIPLGAMTPRFLSRFVYGLLARATRRKQLSMRQTGQ